MYLIMLFLQISFIKFLCYEVDKGDFKKISPKLFYILDKEDLEENEEFGFEFTLLSDIFKGRIEIRKVKCLDNFNILFYKRLPITERFTHELSNVLSNIGLNE